MIDPSALVYSAPAECPSREALVADVAVRAPEAGRSGQSFFIRIERAEHTKRYEGELLVREGAREARRTLHAETCAELAQALALAVATALAPEEPAPPQAPAPPLPALPPPPTTPATAPPTTVTTKTSAAQAGSPPAKKDSSAPSATVGPSFGLDVDLGTASALGPSLAPEGALSAELAWGVRAVRASLAAALGGPMRSATGYGLLRRGLLRVEGCPLGVRLGPVLPMACAGMEVGFLAATGTGDLVAESQLRPWLAPSASLRVRIPAEGRFYADIEGRLAFPLWRDQFYFEPNTDIYEVPPVAVSMSLGAGVRFW